MSEKTEATDAFFAAYCGHTGLDAATRYAVVSFGDSAEMADELGRLVLNGPKRATTSLLLIFPTTAKSCRRSAITWWSLMLAASQYSSGGRRVSR